MEKADSWRGRETGRSSICWFTSEVAAVAGAEWIQSQESGTSSQWLVKALSPSLLLFQSTGGELDGKREQPGYKPGPIMDPGANKARI